MISPLVSIIIPVYNRESIIKETLKSISNQSYSNWECIIIDDGSTDKTEETINGFLKDDDRFKYSKRPDSWKKGANSCRNYGYSIAKGKYINWFDSDDIMESAFLLEKVSAFRKSTVAVLHRNKYANYKLTEHRESKFSYGDDKGLFYAYAMETIEIQTCGFMWLSDYLKGKSLFDENISRYQDNEFHIRMLAYNPKLEVIDAVLATIRSGDGDESQISSRQNLSKKKLYDIFYYRYQCLFLVEKHGMEVDVEYNKTISKKTLWAFYNGLRFEKNLLGRIKDVFKYYGKLRLVYANVDMSFYDSLKSHMYIFKVICFR